MQLEAGTRLGHDEVVSSIGAGGMMGEMYRAKDGRVARQAVRSLVVLVLVLAVLTLTCCGRPDPSPAAEITLIERMNAGSGRQAFVLRGLGL